VIAAGGRNGPRNFRDGDPSHDHTPNTRPPTATQNLRTTFLKIIKRAGLLPWPRLMQNMRSSRETELAARFPLHVATAWMGNSEIVAAKHYLQVREEDFDEALKAVQKPVQQGAALSGMEMTFRSDDREKSPAIPADASPCFVMPCERLAAVGLEPTRPLPDSGF
jgi:hypothetical protein